MASLKGFLDWVKGEDMEDDYEEFIPRSQSAAAASASSSSTASAPEDSLSYTADTQRSNNKVVNIHATTQLAVVLVKPARFENAAEIADHLKDKQYMLCSIEADQTMDGCAPSG